MTPEDPAGHPMNIIYPFFLVPFSLTIESASLFFVRRSAGIVCSFISRRSQTMALHSSWDQPVSKAGFSEKNGPIQPE
jgi:hypothetical protein